MNITFISYTYWPPDFGGELMASIERIDSISQRGHSVTVLTSGRPGFPCRENRGDQIIRRSPLVHQSRWGRALRRITFWFWAVFQLARSKADVAHLGGLGGAGVITSDLLAFFICILGQIQGFRTVVVHSLAESETEIFKSRGWSGLCQMLYYRAVSAIVGVSPALSDGLRRSFGSKVFLIPYGVRDRIFTRCSQSERDVIRSNNEVAEGDTIFVFVGAVGLRKGFDVLARAFADLAKSQPSWHLWVIGPRTRKESQNIDEAEVADVMKPLMEVERQVRYWGRVDERELLSSILSASDVFLFPSRREGMGIAPMEAMSVGVPAIVARIPGVTDLANIHEMTGLFVTPGSLEELKSAMVSLGNDKAKRCRMGKHAAEVIREKFSWDDHITQWIELYQGKRVESQHCAGPGTL